MEATPAIAAPQQQHIPSREPATSNRHRGRGQGRGRGGSSLHFRPASVVPNQQHVPNGAAHTDSSADESGRPQQNRTVNGRQFGGQLTQEQSSTPTTNANATHLQADAVVFVPGQAPANTAAPRQQQPRQPRPPPKRPPKSQAPDIATRTHEDIDNGYYECAICTVEVQRKAKVWACHTCWTVFHLSCIKKWSTNEGSTVTRQQAEGDAAPPRQWRCPGCNLPKDELPSNYTCWCGKEFEPRAPSGVPPHSCGQTCGRERARKCPHPCELTCHAGPCPPCSHMGPTVMCFCGKHETTKRCSETDYDDGWSCGEVCGEVMPCGEHTHEEACHEGLCGACEVRVPARCYCGQTEKALMCCDRGEEMESHRCHVAGDDELLTESWTGAFDCGSTCGRPFDCGVHACEKACHVQNTEASRCPHSPDLVTHCSCGKTPLSDLTDKARESCEDPIPSCRQPCGKLLSCGHRCPAICHTGNCPSCRQVIDIKCRCGRTSSKSICHQGHEEPPQCMRVCRTTLNCGRHACDERCCTGEKKAAERQSVKRKQRPLHAAPRAVDDGFEPEHICTRQCGKLLKCGQHYCEELCHKGACGTCREAVFDEVSCHCGRTVLQPPLPCGTKPPPCRWPCTRPKACGHPQVAHNCHEDNEACPKCPFLVEKQCMCGKHTLKNQPCWLQDVRCGGVCGKRLRCGYHHCRQLCHRPGSCEDANGQPCQQPCGKPKKVCGHPDESLCHSPFSCQEDKPCLSKMFITCACQAQKQEVRCGASKSSDGNINKTLPCNEDCAKMERNRKLALALNIDQSTHVEGGDHVPYSVETLSLFAQKPKWGQTQEREFRVFATSSDEKRLRFKPMKSQERAFIHALAEDFGLDSESMDPEPHRHVMVWKTPRFVSAPSKTLAEALRIRKAQTSAVTSANGSDNEGASKVVKASNTTGEPYNSFLISNPRFGLTVDELRSDLKDVVHPGSSLTFDIEFLPSEEVVLKISNPTITAQSLQQTLLGLRPAVAAVVASKGYGTAQLCTTDSSLNILRRESDELSGDGWSKVAAKRAAPKIVTQTGGFRGSNSFAALSGNKVTFAKKKPEKAVKPKKEVVVDDWEEAETVEEEKERRSPGSMPEQRADDVGSSTIEVKASTVTEPQPNEPVEALDWADQVEQSLS
ncbi:hypothetical protein BAUCODRAFT_143812 [Baudoinia panamericana UAMH 10762]|uniref:R3H domain-containing protein n=1 Tax=Baudoinia panamericana (strain UAMH 10762) TaxID=717646 RepID=M2MXM0_BAUPA|nr:uncharacterized protein BAUCODRAFT_143812 [Baudoinia panamericana UAMH 10762]EMC91414.1 hypothetical protein BAUCODRAFT_143812 [Baudoinia panamericana UAMH 10762]